MLSVVLAFFFGYSLTMRPVLRAGIPFSGAIKVALAADTLSILAMEIVDNAIRVAVPGAMEAGLGRMAVLGMPGRLSRRGLLGRLSRSTVG